MNLIKISFCILLISATIVGFAQTPAIDTLKPLKEVEVYGSRLSEFTSGNKIQVIDSATLNRNSTNNLADLLTNESQVFVKSYGLGSLASTSFRGAGASHTAVLWNGFNIQSPFYGQIDVSLIPITFVNNVQLQYGGAGALWGSGAVGGAIILNNSADYNKGTSVFSNVSFGSFADKQQQVGLEVSKKRFISSLKVFNHDAKNDFPYVNTTLNGSPEQHQSNAELQQYGLLQENYFKINKHQTINTHFWYQMSDRNIPPSMTSNRSVANQQDESYRTTTEWERTGEKLNVQARVGYFDERLRYADSSASIDSKSKSRVTIAEAEARYSFTKYDLLNIGINNTYSEAVSQDYINNPHQNRFALFGSYKVHTLRNTWNAVLSIRQEFVEGKTVPFNASLGVDGKFLKYCYIKANVAQHYRLPTFNDLYYQGAGGVGNPSLKPENGWSEEVSVIHKHHYKTLFWELGATVFNRNINDWILWRPISSTIWSPDNVLKVWSRGVEYKLNVGYSIHHFKIQLSAMYNYILSTNEETSAAEESSLHKQLMYVPIQNAQGSVTVSYRTISITYTKLYTGYRYTQSDNSEFLRPYTIDNINVGNTFNLKTSRVKLFVQLNNIYNVPYQVIRYNAMPLFSYQMGVALYFN